MAGTEIRAEGLKEFARAMRAASPELRKALTRELKGVTELARQMAVHEAHARGLDDTGDLIAGLRSGVNGTTGFVRDVAKHGGYPYPSRIEYESGGEHAFIRPAVDAGRTAIEDRLIAAIEAVIDQANS